MLDNVFSSLSLSHIYFYFYFFIFIFIFGNFPLFLRNLCRVGQCCSRIASTSHSRAYEEINYTEHKSLVILFISFANGSIVLDCIAATQLKTHWLLLLRLEYKSASEEMRIYSRTYKGPSWDLLDEFPGDLCSDVIFRRYILFLVAWPRE